MIRKFAYHLPIGRDKMVCQVAVEIDFYSLGSELRRWRDHGVGNGLHAKARS